MSEPRTTGYACPRCTVGRCTPRHTTFAEIYHGRLLSIPNVKAFVCDVCHFAEFEQATLDALWEKLYGDGQLDGRQSTSAQKRSSTYGEGSS
ncbi:MAG: hypothetical protein OXI77_14255 [Chloroflexota bacterium]|nr:hypothetical protein [Chloroflexota bacterium]MDE2909981.1 hypothetical protein [Chloroflexota bacterium]